MHPQNVGLLVVSDNTILIVMAHYMAIICNVPADFNEWHSSLRETTFPQTKVKAHAALSVFVRKFLSYSVVRQHLIFSASF